MNIIYFFAGTDHSAGSVSGCEGSRVGSKVPSPLVGGLADSWPSPAQPWGGGPGKYDSIKVQHANASSSRHETRKQQNLK